MLLLYYIIMILFLIVNKEILWDAVGSLTKTKDAEITIGHFTAQSTQRTACTFFPVGPAV